VRRARFLSNRYFSCGKYLTEPSTILKLTSMEVHLKPETESRLAELAAKSGRATDDLLEDAMAGYCKR